MPTTNAKPAWETYEFIDYSDRIGDITDTDVESYRRDGWLLKNDFIDPALCEEVLEHIKAWCGITWDEWPEDPDKQRECNEIIDRIYSGSNIFGIRETDPWMFNYIAQPKFGKAAARLIGTPAVKIWSETNQVKLPQGEARYQISWHQDYPNMSIDRVHAVQMWVALRPLTAEMGCMVHMTGSHETPPMGMLDYSGERAEDKYPWLWDKYTPAQPHDMAQGDVYFHHPLVWHYSAPNLTQRMRWGMSSIRIAADCLYTGQKVRATDGFGLEPNKPFDHPNFPTVYDEAKDAARA